MNPARAWKNVMKGKNHNFPTYLIVCDNQSDADYFFELIQEPQFTLKHFIVEYTVNVKLCPICLCMNTIFRYSSEMNSDLRNSEWHKLDYIYLPEYMKELAYEAELNGVTVITEKYSLKQILSREWDNKNLYMRIDNYEKAINY